MKKDNFNSKFREYARTLSPQQSERDFIQVIYKSFNDLLGINNCIQIGSYPRFTSIKPVHDLDIIYNLGAWEDNDEDPGVVMQQLSEKIKQNYKNPTKYGIKTFLQTHSVTIVYMQNDLKVFSVDIVPAYVFSKNEFGEDIYKVPEIIRMQHGRDRIEFYKRMSIEQKRVGWITSDPRGYIKIASEVDRSTNGEFRKTIKTIKKWRGNLEKADKNLKLKSFHLEQVVISYFLENNQLEIFDAIYKFFSELPYVVDNPYHIRDRANDNNFIDDYLANFSEEEKEKIKHARDGFLIKMEDFKENHSIEELLKILFFKRKPSEEFLFDSAIKMLNDNDFIFSIDGFVKPLNGYSSGWLTKTPQLQKGLTRGTCRTRKIEFSIRSNNTSATEHRWKVRNSDDCINPRGEITLNQTCNNPEVTEYIGEHYVECFAIIDNVCIARSRVIVKII